MKVKFIVIVIIITAIFLFVSSDGFFDTPHRAVINADCNYYDHSGNRLGRLRQGQEILFIGSHYISAGIDVLTEVEATVNYNPRGGSILVAVKYITFIEGERFNFWFKGKIMTREYYYTGTIEEIFANSGYTVPSSWDYFETRLVFSDVYLSIHNRDYGAICKIESVTLESSTEEGNIWAFQLSNQFNDEFEVTLIDDGSSIAMTRFVAKTNINRSLGIFIRRSLDYKYVLYNNERSRRTENAVREWRNRQ